MWLLQLWPPTSTVSSIWEDVWSLWESKAFQSHVQEQQWQKSTVHGIEQETTNDNKIDNVNILSSLVLIANNW